ncbi:MAG TPA: molybdenum cofactor guanylyltransferase [Bacteroidales bacterium]|nr:molybdenum cofactor guanylyltransferase [Bacteroidales bacterium]
MVKNISGVVLAGGANKRFNGITKANIVFNGRTIISRILDTIGNVFDEIIIVSNTPEEFKEYSGLKIVGDTFLKAGPLGGIHAGLKSSSKEAIFIFAGDMPLIDERLIVRQIEFYNNNECSILIPVINQYIEPLHSIYNKSIIRTLEEYLSGDHDYAVREFIKIVNFRYMQLEDSTENKYAFTNINSPLDISFVEKILTMRELK